MLEHYDTMPEQAYTWVSQIKSDAPQHETPATEIRPTLIPAAPERELADLDTTKFHTHWSPEVDYQLMNGRTIPQQQQTRRTETVSIIGYARVSTLEQNPELQQHALRQAGAIRIFTVYESGSTAQRP